MSPNTWCHSCLVSHISIPSEIGDHRLHKALCFLSGINSLSFVHSVHWSYNFAHCLQQGSCLPLTRGRRRRRRIFCMSFISFCAITFHGWLILLNESLGFKLKKGIFVLGNFLSLWNSLSTRVRNCLLSTVMRTVTQNYTVLKIR